MCVCVCVCVCEREREREREREMFTDVFLCPAVRGLASDLSLLTIVFPTMIIFCSYRQTQQTGVLLCPAVEDRRVSCLNTVFLTGLFLRKRNTHAFFYVQLSEVKRMSCLALPFFFSNSDHFSVFR